MATFTVGKHVLHPHEGKLHQETNVTFHPRGYLPDHDVLFGSFPDHVKDADGQAAANLLSRVDVGEQVEAED